MTNGNPRGVTDRAPSFHVQYSATFSAEDDCWYAVTALVIENVPAEEPVIWTQFTFQNQALAAGFAERLAKVQAGHIQKKLMKWLEERTAKRV